MKSDSSWTKLTPDEKRKARLKRWLSPSDIKFSSSEAKKAYQERVARFINVIQLEIPDRVPVMLPPGFFPIYCAGVTLQTVMYDYDELCRVWLKSLHEFDMDAFGGPGLVFPGRVYEILDCKLYKWPGHGLSYNNPLYQYIEDEYMKADEYDALIKDPLDYSLRFFLPRTWGIFEPFRSLAPFTSVTGVMPRILSICTRPDVQAVFQAINEATSEYAKWQEAVQYCNREALESGFPSFLGGVAIAPFDYFADILRGTRGIMLDMYRQPDKLLEAMEKVTPLIIDEALATANASGVPSVAMALHKGDDGFISIRQFETFYWPTLKKVLLGLISEGLIPLIFVNGSYMKRLEIIRDLPRASVIWWFDEHTDITRAKKVLGDTASIAGNIPASLLITGTPQDVKEHCRHLIDIAGKNGGYILATGGGVDQGKPDNLRAIMATAKEYGVYQ